MIKIILKLYIIIILLVQLGEVYAASPDNYIELKKTIEYLTSNALGGRLVGSAGEKLATEYVAKQFYLLGLLPAGNHGTYFENFKFVNSVSLGINNKFIIYSANKMQKSYVLHQDWQPLYFSKHDAFKTDSLIFAGYGIDVPKVGNFPSYDSYANLEVKNKWVIVFENIPAGISKERKYQLSPYATIIYKTFFAKTHGAAGIIFIRKVDAKDNQDLIAISFDPGSENSGIFALSVSNKVIADLLAQANLPSNSLQLYQAKLDQGQLPLPPSLAGVLISGCIDLKPNIQYGRNVVARLKVNNAHASYIVIGAHIDHLGHGELGGSLAHDDELGKVNPGADDNASGVASLLAVAKELSILKANNKLIGNQDILFAVWSGEEFGILGSSYFIKNAVKNAPFSDKAATIDANINLDMVGHLRKKLVLQGLGSSLDWSSILKKTREKMPIEISAQTDPYLPTDSTAFYLAGYPIINLFTGASDGYHSPSDLSTTLNYVGIETVSKFLIQLILQLEAFPRNISYQKLPKPDETMSHELRLYLGTIPDYTASEVDGVKLSGIAKDSPAEIAGIKNQDIIIALAGKPIHNIYDYSFVLNSLNAGEPVKLIVLRNSKKVCLTIKARYR